MAVSELDRTQLDREAGERVTAYARQVVAGELVAGELVRLACARHLDDLAESARRGLSFDPEAAGFGIRFFPMLLRHYKGEWGPKDGQPGQPIELLDWEAFVVGSLDGWHIWNDDAGGWVRRFTRAYVEVGKKAGKTLIAAGMGIRRTFFDGEPGAEGYTIATKRDQAKLVWDDGDALVAASPALRARIERSVRALSITATRSKFKPLSSEERGEEGVNPSIGIVDELHRHRDDRMLAMIENSFGARLQPLLLIITTAGEPGSETVWARERRLAELMLRGLAPNDRLFAAVYAIDEDDDPFDEACWIKANPGIGITPKLEEMRQRASEAKAEPAKLNAFLRLRLNRPASAASRYFDVIEWNANTAQPGPADGAAAWGGMDLGWSRDLSAAALWVPRENGLFDLIVRTWAPEAAARARGDGLYERFAEGGWLTLTEGDVRDDEALEAGILEWATSYSIRRWSYDRALASGLVTKLQQARVLVEPVAQGWTSLSPAMKELDRLAAARRIRHGGNPLLAWMIGNTVGKFDDNGNVRPIKPTGNSPDKIDGVSATIDAIAGWLTDEPSVAASVVQFFG